MTEQIAVNLDDLRYLVFEGMKGDPGESPRINPENNHFEVYDNDTQTWVDTGINAKANTFYYISDTVIKSAEDNTAKTGQQIYNETVSNGVCPVIYQHDNGGVTDLFFFQQWHTVGMVFKTLDGRKQLSIKWGETNYTVRSGLGHAVFYLDGNTVKSDYTNLACTGQDILDATLNVGVAPVIRHSSSPPAAYYYHLHSTDSGGLEFRRLDGTKKLAMDWRSSTATIADV